MKLRGFALFLAACFLAVPARAERMSVLSYSNDTIGAYRTDGTTVDPSLISGSGVLEAGTSMVTDGFYLYTTSRGAGLHDGFVGKFGIDGLIYDTTLISGLTDPAAIAADGAGMLYVLSFLDGTVSKYHASTGGLVQEDFITGIDQGGSLVLDPDGNIYISQNDGDILKFGSSGNLLTSFSTGAGGSLPLAYRDGLLYVIENAYTIATYTNDGLLFDSNLVTGLNNAFSLAFDSVGNIYVGNVGNGSGGAGSIVQYNADGTPGNMTITGLTTPSAIVITVPEPSTYALALLGLAALGLTLRRRIS